MLPALALASERPIVQPAQCRVRSLSTLRTLPKPGQILRTLVFGLGSERQSILQTTLNLWLPSRLRDRRLPYSECITRHPSFPADCPHSNGVRSVWSPKSLIAPDVKLVARHFWAPYCPSACIPRSTPSRPRSA